VTRVAVILAAAGAGTRIGRLRKPFLELAGEPLLARCLARFLERADVQWVVAAVPADVHADPPAWLVADPRVRTVPGGAERSDSVRNALSAVPVEADVVLVHDGARPLVPPAVIERCIHAAAAGRSVLAGVAVVDTIQEVDDEARIVATPDRRRLRAAQTPQAFPAAVLRAAYERSAADGVIATDDAALVVRYGGTVHVVDGAAENIKITTVADMDVAETLLRRETLQP
jgi:2-C-methyl-D-erythritol 4-phosphate cytidylyltransferase